MKAQMPKAVQDCHLLLEWMIPVIEKFPRTRRFTLGERIEQGLLQVLECLIKATYGLQRSQSLEQANVQLEVIRHLWRLSYNLKVIAIKQYDYGSELMLSLGRQIGGWKKSKE